MVEQQFILTTCVGVFAGAAILYVLLRAELRLTEKQNTERQTTDRRI